MSDTPGPNQNIGRNPVPKSLVEERRKTAVALRVAGLSMQSVLGELNKPSAAGRWGVIGLRTLERDIAAYYRKTRLLDPNEDRDHMERLRDCHIAQMENLLEEIALTIAERNKKNDWRPFEKIAAVEKLYKMRVQMAELQGWNYGKSRSTVNISNNFKPALTELEKIEQTNRELDRMPEEDRRRLAEEIRSYFDGCQTEEEERVRRAEFLKSLRAANANDSAEDVGDDYQDYESAYLNFFMEQVKKVCIRKSMD